MMAFSPTMADTNRVQIQKDVERTFQDDPFFRQESTKIAMEEALLAWAMEHPNFEYQQGMNEIFAVILCTLRDEYVGKIPAYWEHCQDPAHLKTDEMLLELCDNQHLFADTFMLFEKILDQGISSMYFNADEE